METSGDLQHQPVHPETGPGELYHDLVKRLEKVENMCSNRRNRRYNQNRMWNGSQTGQKDKSDGKRQNKSLRL